MSAESFSSEQRYRALARNFPNGAVLLFDHDLRYVIAEGDELFRARGMNGAQIVGKTLRDVARSEHVDELERVYREALAGKKISLEVGRDGRDYDVQISPVVEDGIVIAGMVVMYDITERQRGARELRESHDLLDLLQCITLEANRVRTAREAVAKAVEAVGTRLGFPVGHALEVDGDGNLRSTGVWWPDVPWAFAAFRQDAEKRVLAPGEGLPGHALVQGKPLWIANLFATPWTPSGRVDAVRAEGLESGLAFPIKVDDRVVAVLEFFSNEERIPNQKLLEAMEVVGATLGHVYARERYTRRVEQISNTDELTQLRNRRGFMAAADAALAADQVLGKSTLLVFADLDGLKKINDGLGHEQGDAAIREAADALSQAFRGTDVVGRLGGDEFAVVVRNADATHAPAIVSRVEKQIQALNARAGRGYRLSLSIGFVARPAGSRASLDDLVARADADMYAEKRTRKAPVEPPSVTPPASAEARRAS